jgi:hypothetical protein
MRRPLCLLLLLILSASVAVAGTILQVGVKTGQLRATPMPFGKIVATPHYGEKVEELAVDGAWRRVRYGKTEGWMHNTLLSTKVAKLAAGQEAVGGTASSEDLTLAGKGFNAQVESAYRKQNGGLDYATIDRMEKQTVTQKQMSSFLADGGLLPEGARP